MKLFSTPRRFALCSSLAFLTLLPGSAETRTFTDQKGRKIEAEIIGKTGTTVTLRLASGKSYTIPTKTLSGPDQLFVEVWEEGDGTGGAKPVIPEGLDYRVEFEVDKERVKKGTETRQANMGETKTDEWLFEVEVENNSGVTLEGLEASYRIYVTPEASVKLTFDTPPKFYGGRLKMDPVEDRKSVKGKTRSVPLTELVLDPDFIFNDGSRNDLEDELEGIWIKLWHGEKKVAEYKSNNSVVKEAKWADNEAADPNAKPAEEPAPQAEPENGQEE